MELSFREHIIDRIFRLKNQIAIYKAKEYATNEPILLLNSQIDIIDVLANRLDQEVDIDETGFRRIGIFLEVLHNFLNYVINISTTNIPIELLPIFKKILTENDSSYSIILRPDTDFNYSFIDYSKIINEIFWPLSRISDVNICIINYPLSETNNLLLNCILFHELGHLLIEELNIREEIKEELVEITSKNISEYYNALKEHYDNIKKITHLDELTLDDFVIDEDYQKSKIAEKLHEILTEWIDEIIADLIAFHYIGVAYILAISEFLLIHKTATQYSDSHPPLFLRLKILFKLYTKMRYGSKMQIFGTVTKHIAKYKKIAQDSFNKHDKNIDTLKCIVLENKIINTSNNILDILHDKLSQTRPTFVRAHIESAVKSYLNLIPPAEYFIYESKRRESQTPFTILNAAWIVKENNRKQLYRLFSGNDKEARISISDLAKKALEVIEYSNRLSEEV